MVGRAITSRLAIVSVAIVVAAVCFATGVHGAAPAYASISVGWQDGAAGTVTAQVPKDAGTYRVVFKANGGKGKMGAQKVKRGKRAALRANKFKRSGYKFAGWNTKRNGKGKSLKNKAKVRNLVKKGKTVKLYAQWKKASKKYSIKTPYYKVTVPRVWRGKVQWVTKEAMVEQYSSDRSGKTGNTFKTYHTLFYLKGHKGDNRYWLATIGGERQDCPRMTGFNSDKASVTTMQKDKKIVYLLAANMPARIAWRYDSSSGWHSWATSNVPSSVDDQKQLLTLTTGDSVSYEYAKSLGVRDSVSCSYVTNYLKPKFESLKIR